jgi:hypothetical protein
MRTGWRKTGTRVSHERRRGDTGVQPEEGDVPAPSPERQSPVRMALIVATSALLGGITVVLWNRRILEGMRQPVVPNTPDERAERSGDEEFI